MRDEDGKLLQARYEEHTNIYKHSSSAERVMGTIKNRWSDGGRIKKEELAMVYVLARFVLWKVLVHKSLSTETYEREMIKLLA